MLSKYLSRFDIHIQEVLRNLSFAFIIKVISSFLSFGFNILIARLLGADGAGIFFLALAITIIASVIGRLGLDNAILRHISISITRGDYGKAYSIYSFGIKWAFIASFIATFVLYFIAPWVADSILGKPELTNPIRWMALSILPFSLLNLQAEALKACKRITSAMLIQGASVPVIAIFFILFSLDSINEINKIIFSYTLATVITALVGHLVWKKNKNFKKTRGEYYSSQEVWVTSKPLYLVSIMNKAILPWLPLFLLGVWASNEAVGIFGAATRISMLVTFLLVTMNNVLAPKFGELITNNDIRTLTNVVRKSALLILALTSPIFILLIFQGELVMSIFGREFQGGVQILAILAIGQIVNVATGSVGYLLIMGGYESEYKALTIWTTLFLIALCVILIPIYNEVGAAIAVSCSVIANNVGASLTVYKKLGISVIKI